MLSSNYLFFYINMNVIVNYVKAKVGVRHEQYVQARLFLVSFMILRFKNMLSRLK